VILEESLTIYDAWDKFYGFYNKNGKQAGTYTFKVGIFDSWKKTG
jgi:hypothetical protein